MKEKLLRLIQACIEDKTMYEDTYIHDEKKLHLKYYRGINIRDVKHSISHVSEVKHKGGKVVVNHVKYFCDLTPYHKEIKAHEITFGFGKEPSIVIKKILKGNNYSREKTIVTAEGYIDFWLMRPQTKFDLTVVHEEYHYELRCGSFAYIIEDEIVDDIVNNVNEKRRMIKNDAELKVINERFKLYHITQYHG